MVTGVQDEAKGTHINLTTANMDRVSSAVIRTTMMEVGQDNRQIQGNSWGGSDKIGCSKKTK